MSEESRKTYYVYIVECADATLYTGVTLDVEKRLLAHNSQKTGAKYTKSRRPVELRYSELVGDKGTALQREHEIKQMARHEKLKLLQWGSEVTPD